MENIFKVEHLISIIIASITIFLTSLFTHIFTLKTDAKQVYSKYRVRILEELYTPIYKIMIRDVSPLDGYDGISVKQFNEIKSIIENNYVLVDAKLDSIIWGFKEEVYVFGQSEYNYLDAERKLLIHVERQYNKLRKSVGLPYEKNSNARIRIQRILKRFIKFTTKLKRR